MASLRPRVTITLDGLAGARTPKGIRPLAKALSADGSTDVAIVILPAGENALCSEQVYRRGTRFGWTHWRKAVE